MHHRYYLNHKEKIKENNNKWRANNKKKVVELVAKSRRKRIDRLRAEGVVNAWSVVNYGKEPKYKVGE